MSIHDLPHEVLNLVFSQIHDKTAAPTAESQATFSSLCLTSKFLLPLAREYLYYRPVRFRTNLLSWENSFGLLLVLQQPRSPLAQLVRSLEDITSFLDRLRSPDIFYSVEKSDPSDLALLTKYSGSYDFLLRLLQICNNLEILELALWHSDQVANVTRSLQVSTPTIKTLHLLNCRQPVVQETLDHPLFQHIETLVVTNFDFNFDPPSDSAHVISRIKLPLKALRFHRDDLNIEFLKFFIPEDPSSLVDFALSFDQKQLSDISLSAILNLLSPTLHRLSLQCRDLTKRSPGSRPSVDNYSKIQGYPKIPLDLLSRFTSLRTLVLDRFQGPSLALLETLATSSPSLQSIDFSSSQWIPPARTSLLTPESIFPSTEIHNTLCTFESLRYIHFGYLPTSRREDHEELICKLRERGIVARWSECRPALPWEL